MYLCNIRWLKNMNEKCPKHYKKFTPIPLAAHLYLKKTVNINWWIFCKWKLIHKLISGIEGIPNNIIKHCIYTYCIELLRWNIEMNIPIICIVYFSYGWWKYNYYKLYVSLNTWSCTRSFFSTTKLYIYIQNMFLWIT